MADGLDDAPILKSKALKWIERQPAAVKLALAPFIGLWLVIGHSIQTSLMRYGLLKPAPDSPEESLGDVPVRKVDRLYASDVAKWHRDDA